MTVREMIDKMGLEVLCEGDNMDAEVLTPACCDLLSIAMGTLPEGCAWVTVMSNINTLAVASLADAACVILALNTAVTDDFLAKANMQGITVLRSSKHIFETALEIQRLIEA